VNGELPRKKVWTPASVLSILFLDCSVDHITLVDSGTWPTNFTYAVILGRESYVLEVVACQGVFVELSEIPGNPKASSYEVALGIDDNTKSELRLGLGGSVLQSHSGAVLHCSELKAFWFAWNRGTLTAGLGSTVGSNQILQHHDSNALSIHSVGVAALEGVDAMIELRWATNGMLHNLKFLHH
jgi:hypothetical protein